MSELTSDLAALQSENVLKTSRRTARIADDDQGMKALLATSNDKGFSLTSNPRARKKRGKWHARVNRRPSKSSLKGKRVNSTALRARIRAEPELLQFRCSKESKESEMLTMERARESKSVPSDAFVDGADSNDASGLLVPNHSLPIESVPSSQMPPDEQESNFKTKGVCCPKKVHR